jgi:phenylpropionate dioxygenase-like ring-hydroxylating dioxygenase large terminal subunit
VNAQPTPEPKTTSPSNSRLYKPYVDAKWGFKNHWFPALFSKELGDGEFKAITICGEPILLRREKGKVYAVQDRCCHRGVKFSVKPFSFRPCTVTCWYHGFTYGLDDGVLKTILAAPDDPLIGKLKLKVYPVEEKYTMIFVFVGDPDYQPLPALETDLPPPLKRDYKHFCPSLFDEDTVVLGIRRSGNSNWRLAVENGFDPGHVLIHWKSPLVYALDLALPLGFKPISNRAIETFEEEGQPIGIINNYVPDDDGTRHYELILENKDLGIKAKGGKPLFGLRTSMWLPCVLRVENFPFDGIMAYEFYVPTTDDTYEYFQIMVFSAKTEEMRAEAVDRFDNYLKDAVFKGFSDDDLWAREAMQSFYGDNLGFDEEKLGTMDAVIVGWRKLAARHARGIQAPPSR